MPGDKKYTCCMPPALVVVRVITTWPPMPTSWSAKAVGMTPPGPCVESLYAPSNDSMTSAECSSERRSTPSAAMAKETATSRALPASAGQATGPKRRVLPFGGLLGLARQPAVVGQGDGDAEEQGVARERGPGDLAEAPRDAGGVPELGHGEDASSRVAWTALAGYALLVVVAFAMAAEG